MRKRLVPAILLALAAGIAYYTVLGLYALFWTPIYLSR